MPGANATFYNQYGKIDDLLIAPNLYPYLALEMYKEPVQGYSTGDLVAKDATGYIIPFNEGGSGSETTLVGIVLDDVSSSAESLRVVTAGVVKASKIDYSGLSAGSPGASDFAALPNVNANVPDPDTFQGDQAIVIHGIDES